MARQTGELTPWQLLVIQNYGGGDYAHMTTIEEVRAAHEETFLDTLGYFLMIELDPDEDCTSWEEAQQRLASARDDVQGVHDMVAEQVAEAGR